MADAETRARVHAERLVNFLKIWQPESLLGKHAPGLPYYGLLGVNLADFFFHEATNGHPLGNVTGEIFVDVL
eukprot:12926072-Alexandrium_andersonii.AAC.1